MDTQFFSLGDQTPQDLLETKAHESNFSLTSQDFAAWMDRHDPLGHIRQEFFCPKLSTLPKGTSYTDANIDLPCLFLSIF